MHEQGAMAGVRCMQGSCGRPLLGLAAWVLLMISSVRQGRLLPGKNTLRLSEWEGLHGIVSEWVRE